MINTSVNGIIMEMVKMVRVRKSLDIWHLRDSRDWLLYSFFKNEEWALDYEFEAVEYMKRNYEDLSVEIILEEE